VSWLADKVAWISILFLCLFSTVKNEQLGNNNKDYKKTQYINNIQSDFVIQIFSIKHVEQPTLLLANTRPSSHQALFVFLTKRDDVGGWYPI